MSTTASVPVAATPRPKKPSLGWKPWAWLGAFLAATALAMWALEFTLIPSIRRPEHWFKMMGAFLTPNWSFFPRIIDSLWVTFSIAFVAAVLVAAATMVLSMLASKVSMRTTWVYRLTKGMLSVMRSLPDVVWALLFVAFFGIGPFAGTLAMAAFGLGIVAKLTAETIDAVDRGPLDAVDTAGGTGFQRARVAIVPQILPNYTSYTLYNFEAAVRGSIVLGYVSAGGIGQILQAQSNFGNYDNVALIVLATLALVVVIDSFSYFLRRWLSR